MSARIGQAAPLPPTEAISHRTGGEERTRERLTERIINPVSEESRGTEYLEESIEALNETVNVVEKSLQFELHDDTERVIVRVVDTKSSEVIKEIPPEEILNLVAKLQDMVGVFIDEQR